ncbi:hypothetical protein E4U41_002874 [Claviceps citrina]|nr:hypothetical protein E4U41_002874 [Claviceps citrina]
MKYGAFVLSALAAVAAAATPSFLNSDFVVKEGASFTLKFSNCQGGCTITLQTGPQTNTKDVRTLTSSATGDSFTFTPKDIATGTYNFKITSNTNSSEFNYSKQFAYAGTGAIGASSSGASSSNASSSNASASNASSTASTSSVTTSSSTASATASTTMASVTIASSSGSTTSASGKTTSQRSTSTRSAAAAATTVPNAGGRASSPLALVAGAVAALAYLG